MAKIDLRSYVFDNEYSDIDKTKSLHFGEVMTGWDTISKFIIKDVEVKTPIRN